MFNGWTSCLRKQDWIPGRNTKRHFNQQLQESNFAIKANLSFNMWSKTEIRWGCRWKRHEDKEHKALTWTSEPSTFDAIRAEETSFCLPWQEKFCFALFISKETHTVSLFLDFHKNNSIEQETVITPVMLTLLKSHLLLDQEYYLLLFNILQPATLKAQILQIVLKYI